MFLCISMLPAKHKLTLACETQETHFSFAFPTEILVLLYFSHGSILVFFHFFMYHHSLVYLVTRSCFVCRHIIRKVVISRRKLTSRWLLILHIFIAHWTIEISLRCCIETIAALAYLRSLIRLLIPSLWLTSALIVVALFHRLNFE